MRTFGWAQMCLTPSLCGYPLEALYEAAAPISPLAALRWTRNLPDLSLLISNLAAMAGSPCSFSSKRANAAPLVGMRPPTGTRSPGAGATVQGG